MYGETVKRSSTQAIQLR